MSLNKNNKVAARLTDLRDWEDFGIWELPEGFECYPGNVEIVSTPIDGYSDVIFEGYDSDGLVIKEIVKHVKHGQSISPEKVKRVFRVTFVDEDESPNTGFIYVQEPKK